MRAAVIWGAAAILGGALLAGCAAGHDTHPKLVWLRADGSPATRAELEAAKQACLAATPPDASSPHPSAERHEFASHVVACVQSKGYRLVEEPTP